MVLKETRDGDMPNPFEKKSSKAQWEIVTEVLEKKSVGDIVTYEEVLKALGPGFPRAALSSVVWHAIRKFRDHKRTFVNVRKVGWRMAEATEHSRLARREQLRSKRRLVEAVSIVDSTDVKSLTSEQRRALQEQNLHLRRLLDQVSRRVDSVEERVAVVEKEQSTTEDKIDYLTNLLRRHGIE